MAKLVVVSHKPCWRSSNSASGYATDGGFPYQMRALSELFDETVIVAPCSAPDNRPGERALEGPRMRIVPLSQLHGADLERKLALPGWLLRNGRTILRQVWQADAVHTPIPGDIGTLGMLAAWGLRKPLFVRHCGNFAVRRTIAEWFWRWFMEHQADLHSVMLATGASDSPPSVQNPAIGWIFSTSMTADEMRACQTLRLFPTQRPPRLIAVCRQEKGKGVEVTLESLPQLQKDFPGITLAVVGTGSALGDFQQRTLALGLQEIVTFHGQVDQPTVLRLLQEADLFCFPTASEGFPKVVLEALACGLPVVTTRVSALPKLIGTGCGVLLDAVSPQAVANAVRECLSNPQRYHQMAEKAQATAQQYTLENWRAALETRLTAAWGPLRSDVRTG